MDGCDTMLLVLLRLLESQQDLSAGNKHPFFQAMLESLWKNMKQWLRMIVVMHGDPVMTEPSPGIYPTNTHNQTQSSKYDRYIFGLQVPTPVGCVFEQQEDSHGMAVCPCCEGT